LFNNRFDFFHGRVHLISLVATFLSMFLPWIVADDTIDRFEILGIQTILSNIFMGLLILNILVSTLRHNKLVSIFNIMIGILCFIIVLMTFIGYYLPVSVTFGVIRFGVGIYIALIGTIGIVVSGFLSLAKNKK
jgi:hypothetical protein